MEMRTDKKSVIVRTLTIPATTILVISTLAAVAWLLPLSSPGVATTWRARALVRDVNANRQVFEHQLPSILNRPPDTIHLVDNQRELMYYLGSSGLFGFKAMVVRVDAKTGQVVSCYIFHD